MYKNENGSALLTVLLMLIIFTTLGMALFSISINGAKKTEIREDEVHTNIDGLTGLKEGIAQVENFVEDNKPIFDELALDPTEEKLNKLIYIYDQKLAQFIDDVNNSGNKHNYTIENITSDYDKIGKSATRALKISNQVYSQKVYIDGTSTITPVTLSSFWNYALSSSDQLTIHDGVIDGPISSKENVIIQYKGKVNGDVHSRGNIVVQHNGDVKGDILAGGSATIHNGGKVQGNISANSSVAIHGEAYVNGYIYSKQNVLVHLGGHITEDIYAEGDVTIHGGGIVNGNIYAGGNVILHSGARVSGKIIENTPIEKPATQNETNITTLDAASTYNKRNSSYTYVINNFIEQLIKMGFESDELNTFKNTTNAQRKIQTYLNEYIKNETNPMLSNENFFVIKNTDQLLSTIQNTQTSDSQIYYIDKGVNIKTNLSIGEEDWIIINGDVHLISKQRNNKIEANMLVTGDVNITGNGDHSIRSIIYNLGNVDIDLNPSRNINNINSASGNDLSFILLTNGTLKLGPANNINGFFYATKKVQFAEVKNIIGGIFSEVRLTTTDYMMSNVTLNNDISHELLPTLPTEGNDDGSSEITLYQIKNLNVTTDRIEKR